ncbi:MAG: DUF1947 domain-containing protein [Candidatus Bathyarchaeia archaeon]
MRLKRRDIRRREASIVLEKLKASLNLNLDIRPDRCEVVDSDDFTLYILDGEPVVFKIGDEVYPTLLFGEVINMLPKVFVDRGAIPHICNGADVMAPGIVRIEGVFGEGGIVAICDEKYSKTIALGKALKDSEVIKSMGRGRAIETIHYIGDRIWRFIKMVKSS